VACSFLGCGAPSSDPAVPVVDVAPEGKPVVLTADPAPAPTPAPEAPAPPIEWMRSFEDATREALTTRRPLLVYCHADWNGMSLEMERDIWADERVRRAARATVTAALDLSDARAANANGTLARLGVSHVPTTLLLASDGRELWRIEGLVNVETMLALLARIP
jgi:thiol:disulfide interchange protein